MHSQCNQVCQNFGRLVILTVRTMKNCIDLQIYSKLGTKDTERHTPFFRFVYLGFYYSYRGFYVGVMRHNTLYYYSTQHNCFGNKNDDKNEIKKQE